MKYARLISVAILIAITSFVAAAQVPQLKKMTSTKTDRFDFGSGGTVVITGAPVGSIKVVGWSANEIEITAVVEVEAANDADLAQLSSLTGFVTEESAMRTGITTVGVFNKFGLKKLPKGFPKNLQKLPFKVDYTVKVPRFCDLEIDGGKGDLSIYDVEGSIRANYLESNVQIDVVGGSLALTIGAGDVDVTFGRKGWRGRNASIALAKGNLNVELPTNLSAEIDATVIKGSITENSLVGLKPRDRKVPFTDNSIMAKAGVGGVTLKFAVADGSLSLKTLKLPT